MAQVVAVFAVVIALGAAMFWGVGLLAGIPLERIVKAIADGGSLIWLFSFAGVWALVALCFGANMNQHKGE